MQRHTRKRCSRVLNSRQGGLQSDAKLALRTTPHSKSAATSRAPLRRSLPGAKTPDAEKTTLDQWSKEQDKTPWLRFSTAGSNGSDPGENTEAVGDADAIYSTGLGLKNLNRVMSYLLEASTTKKGDPYDDLASVYG